MRFAEATSTYLAGTLEMMVGKRKEAEASMYFDN
jgi:hypothetical protein